MRRLMIAAVVLSAAACASAPAPAPAPKFQPCNVGKIERPVYCGKLAVPENRAKRGGRTIEINVAVSRAEGADRKPDPIFAVLGGGPGVAGLPELASFMSNHAELLRDRDVIAIDPRGTGESNPLDCPVPEPQQVAAFLAGEFPLDAIGACRERLQADFGGYTTEATARDVEDVRRWLGYGPINIYGGSYTSRVALVYAQLFPKSTRTAILKAPTPFANRNPLNAARDAQAALDRLFADCAADAACNAAYPTLRADFDAVLAQLAKDPTPISRDVFAGVIRRLLYATETQRMIPSLIASAKRGDFAPVQRILGAAGQIDKVLNVGLFLSVTCAEDVAHYTRRDVEEATRGTFTGERLAAPLLELCKQWPVARVAPIEKRSNVPALVLFGSLDPQTPARWANEVKRLLPNAVIVEAANVAHSGTTPCLAGIMRDFVRNPAAQPDTACAMSEKRPGFTLPK